jgi:hypothetical protein
MVCNEMMTTRGMLLNMLDVFEETGRMVYASVNKKASVSNRT